jgi:Fe-S cluster biogenesis protein NfuA
MDKQALLERINLALDEIRPHLHADGGDVEVIDLSDELDLTVRWMGNCESCNMAPMTMKGGVESTIKHSVPEVRSITAINGIKLV